MLFCIIGPSKVQVSQLSSTQSFRKSLAVITVNSCNLTEKNNQCCAMVKISAALNLQPLSLLCLWLDNIYFAPWAQVVEKLRNREWGFASWLKLMPIRCIRSKATSYRSLASNESDISLFDEQLPLTLRWLETYPTIMKKLAEQRQLSAVRWDLSIKV